VSCWQLNKSLRQLQLQGSHSGIITAPIDQGGLTGSAGAFKYALYCQGVVFYGCRSPKLAKVKPMDKVVSTLTHGL